MADLALHHELTQLLYHEAELLDGGRFEEWLDLMAEDVRYQVPVRLTRERGQHPDHSFAMQSLDEDLTTLRLRVKRLRTDFAWAEDPPSRTRHFVANVRVSPGQEADSWSVRSYILVYRSRGDSPAPDLISGERQDVWRRTPQGWKLASRTVMIDQATLGTKNFAIFI